MFLLTGVVLLGLSLRHAVTVVSPLLATIQRDIGLDQVGATILGMLPTIAFGIAAGTTAIVEQTRRSYPGRVEMGEDLMVIDIGADVRVKQRRLGCGRDSRLARRTGRWAREAIGVTLP